MSKELQVKIDELYENTKDLMSREDIQPYCDEFNEWIRNSGYSIKSLGSLFSRYKFYTRFKALKLIECKNATVVTKHDVDGNPKGTELKHWVVVLSGLSSQQWAERNDNSAVIERVTSDDVFEIDPDKYLEITTKLLTSDDVLEVAAGIIASTGRRPVEIVARGNFEEIEGENYKLLFSGQLKKRNEKPVYEIPTLHPANYILKKFKFIRNSTKFKNWLKKAEQNNTIGEQNIELDNSANTPLNRIIERYYGKGVLKPRSGKENVTNGCLRAAYAVLATERDCNGSFSSKLLYAAEILGHIVNKQKDLGNLKTTLGYTDYKVMKKPAFVKMKQADKLVSIRAYSDDREELQNIQDELDISNQPDVISHLIENYKKAQSAFEELNKAKKRIAELEKMEKSIESKSSDNQNQYLTVAEFNQQIENLKSLVLSKPDTRTVIKEQPKNQEKPETDWSKISNQELWHPRKKYRGGSIEKIERSFEAICQYNDIAKNKAPKIAITNQSLRGLSGVNGQNIKEWMEANKEHIFDHHKKHDLLNENNPNSLETYHNKKVDSDYLIEYIGWKILGIFEEPKRNYGEKN